MNKAQDIGLHRAESAKQNIELRRRVWASCVIADRWSVNGVFFCDPSADLTFIRMALGFGHPYMIDVQDCDVRLPSSGDPGDLYMVEMVRLSVLLGRILKAVYRYVYCSSRVEWVGSPSSSPSGLNHTTDDMLQTLLADIEAWKNSLPESLRYNGPDTSLNAGMHLHSCYLAYV
jgi:hypothetical protein